MMAFLLGPIGRWLIVAVLAGSAYGWLHHIQSDRTRLRGELAAAQKQVADTQAALAGKERELAILNQVRVDYDAKLQSLDVLARDVRHLAGAVSLCNSVVAVPPDVPGASTGTGEAGGSDGTRPAADVLVELATDFATERDQLAVRLNALIDWLERTRQ